MALSNIFRFDNKVDVRVVTKNNKPWFCAQDVCHAVDLKNSRSAITKLDDDEKKVVKVDTSGGEQGLVFINEYGLYSIILRSNKPTAKPFKRWITHDVIPAINPFSLHHRTNTLDRDYLVSRLEYQLAHATEFGGQTNNYIYIASSELYMRNDMYKIGSTNNPTARCSSLNTSRHVNDKLYMLNIYEVSDGPKIEHTIHTDLYKYRHSHEREFFVIPYIQLLGVMRNIIIVDFKLNQ